MSVVKRDGRWHYRFKLRGETFRGTTGLEATRQNLNAAKSIEASKRLEEANGKKVERVERIPFSEAAVEFLAWCKSTEYRKKPSTAKRIIGSFASLKLYFGDSDVANIPAIEIERYKTWRSAEHHIKDVTLRNDLNALSLFFKYAIKAGWRTRGSNPLLGDDKIKRPSGEDAVRMHILTAEEEVAYFEVARGNLYDVAKFILLQGARPEEVMALKHTSYLRSTGQIQIEGGKTRAARRLLNLCGESIEIIERRMRAPGPWLFPSPRNPGDHIRQLHTTHDSVCQDASVSFVLYDLRHTFATRLAVDAKTDLPSLAAILGHSSLRQVQKYVHPTAEHQRDAMRRYEAILPKANLRAVMK